MSHGTLPTVAHAPGAASSAYLLMFVSAAAFATMSAKRNVSLPEVPTVAESGFPGFEVTVWYAACAQSAVPRPILDKLHATLVKTLRLPEVRARLAESSIEATPTSQDEFAAFILAETDRWARVVKDANIPKQ